MTSLVSSASHQLVPAGAEAIAQAEPTAVSRKKALLRILSLGEAERAGIAPSPAELAEFVRAFRRSFALDDDARLNRWLARAGLGQSEFERLLLELCVQNLLEQHLASRIDTELNSQEALWSLHAWARAEESR